jgi:hypothetical protein
MNEAIGDLWEAKPQFIKCITTNGDIKKNGELVMGRGVALQAKQKYPELPKLLGEHVKKNGNIAHYFEKYNIISFPTKIHWRDKANLNLIRHSCYQLNALLDGINKQAVLPRPGCNNGELNWEREVKPTISMILIDKVWVITNERR